MICLYIRLSISVCLSVCLSVCNMSAAGWLKCFLSLAGFPVSPASCLLLLLPCFLLPYSLLLTLLYFLFTPLLSFSRQVLLFFTSHFFYKCITFPISSFIPTYFIVFISSLYFVLFTLFFTLLLLFFVLLSSSLLRSQMCIFSSLAKQIHFSYVSYGFFFFFFVIY